MKRKPALHKLVFRASAPVKSWLDDRAHALVRSSGCKTLTEARGCVLDSLIRESVLRGVVHIAAPGAERGQA